MESIFFPDVLPRLARMHEEGARFVHYTSAEVAVNIIQNAEVWMRNAQTMNDFSEVSYGLDCLHRAWPKEAGQRVTAAINAAHPGAMSEVVGAFDSWRADMLGATYLTSLSEHPPDENEYGRLSMWRAYGGRNGVALVLDLTPFLASTDELKAYSSPVNYASSADFEAQMLSMAVNMEQHPNFLQGLPRQAVIDTMFAVLRFGAMCTKHPAFKEEREWRILYSPNLATSPVIKREVATVRGVPQIIQKIPLRDKPELGLVKADVPSLLQRVIIGPTEDGASIFDALMSVMNDAGIENAHERIHVSGIPLRQF